MGLFHVVVAFMLGAHRSFLAMWNPRETLSMNSFLGCFFDHVNSPSSVFDECKLLLCSFPRLRLVFSLL